MPIVRDGYDRTRFVESLFHLNDTFVDPNWTEAIASYPSLVRPEHWPDQDRLVHILAWTLVPNHFHLLLQEIREGGIAKFMQRLCGSMTMAFNSKYQEAGSMFQSSYKGKTVDEDTYLRYLAFYIQIKNVLEQRPGGLRKALSEFDAAWEWALAFPYSSLGDYVYARPSPVIEPELLLSMFPDPNAFKREAYEMLSDRINRDDDRAPYLLEPW